MKNFKFYLSIFILSFVLINCKKETKPSENKSEITQKTKKYVVTQGKHCFLSTIDSPLIKGKDTIHETNRLLLNFVVTDNKVTGNYDYIPYKQEAVKGTFEGTLENDIVTSICNTIGSDNKKEEFIFKIQKEKVLIFGGEKIKKEGIWYFVDKNKGFYMNELPRINCN